MIKKLWKIFLVVLFIWIIYLYLFPTYPDYWVSDNNFLTRHHDKDFNSIENGFHLWKDLHEYLWENKDFLDRIDSFYKCKIEDTCASFILTECVRKWMCSKDGSSNQDRDYIIQYLQNDFIDSWEQEKIDKIIQEYLWFIEKINEKEFILSLDARNFKDNSWALGSEWVRYTPFFDISRIIGYRWPQYNEKKKFQVYSKNYIWLINILNKFDGVFIDYGSLQVAIKNQSDFILQDYKTKNAYSVILKKLIENNPISSWYTANAIKRDYIIWRLYLENGWIDDFKKYTRNFSLEWWEIWIPFLKFLPKFLFYSQKETINLLTKNQKNKLMHANWEKPIEHFKYNWKNLIWRWFVNQSAWLDFSTKFKKENEFIESQKTLLETLY